jgi:hypothetical protein
VQFTESVRTVAALGCSVLMEIGPQPILTAAALQTWPESAPAPTAIVSLRKGANAQRQITEALASTSSALLDLFADNSRTFDETSANEIARLVQVCAAALIEDAPLYFSLLRHKRSIAKGSGVQVSDVNNLLKRFEDMQQMMRKLGKMQKMMGKFGGKMPMMSGMGGFRG